MYTFTITLWLVYQTKYCIRTIGVDIFALLLSLHDSARMLIWKEAKGLYLHCALLLLSLNWCCFYELSSIKGYWYVFCFSWSSLLSGRIAVQESTYPFDGLFQRLAKGLAKIGIVESQPWTFEVNYYGIQLPTNGTAQIQGETLIEDV